MGFVNERRVINKTHSPAPQPTSIEPEKPPGQSGSLQARSVRLPTGAWQKLTRIGRKLSPINPLKPSAVIRRLIEHYQED